MVSLEKIDGICNTCNHVFECPFLKRSQTEGKVIWHCEEFDDPDLQSEKNRERKNPIVMRSGNLIPGWDR